MREINSKNPTTHLCYIISVPQKRKPKSKNCCRKLDIGIKERKYVAEFSAEYYPIFFLSTNHQKFSKINVRHLRPPPHVRRKTVIDVSAFGATHLCSFKIFPSQPFRFLMTALQPFTESFGEFIGSTILGCMPERGKNSGRSGSFESAVKPLTLFRHKKFPSKYK